MTKNVSLLKDLLITLALGAAAVAVSFAAGWVGLGKTVTPEPPSAAVNIDTLKSEDIVGFSDVDRDAGPDVLVSYRYAGAALPAKLSPDEVVEKRTANSWTRVAEKAAAGKDPVLTTVVYPADTFVERPDGWHYVRQGQTTKAAMDAYLKENPISALFMPVAHAASFNSPNALYDGDIYSNAGINCGTGGGWTNSHNAATGIIATSSSFGTMVAGYAYSGGKVTSCTIYRAFLPFDTSVIPAAATIRSATLNLFASSTTLFPTLAVGDSDNDGVDYITVVQTIESNYTVLVTGDYTKCGSAVTTPTEGIATTDRKDLTSLADQTWVTFPLNATGLGWIKQSGAASACSASTGITCIGVREGHDTTNTFSPSGTGTDFLQFSDVESSTVLGNTTQEPYIDVTYSLPIAFWQFQDY